MKFNKHFMQIIKTVCRAQFEILIISPVLKSVLSVVGSKIGWPNVVSCGKNTGMDNKIKYI